jgi:hypothetical protein
MTPVTASSRVYNIRRSSVGSKMPRALVLLDATLRRIEQSEIDGLLEGVLAREPQNKAALRMARLPIL